MIKAQREYQMRAIGFENNGAFEIQRQNIAKAALMQRVALPLVGVTSMADQSVRIDAMEPFINDAFAPRILFSPGLVALLDELDSWPEPQTGHHYDGLCALSILWMIASTRAGSYEFTPVPGRRSSADSSEFKDSFDIGGRMGGDW
ncbi:hypothetical protein AAAC11_00130 [Pseudomonas aeruginosa]|nr:hypothetical protein [Pseudomonas aeruginosa]MDF5881708.1 hypothetical protein [Pseudomonas aeruginosa]MDF5917008.1 hypothetical protein [Pseudomonas aeruginosa]MDF5921444.1 hypothetical protein [Pseudomonas aeruginosa]WOF37685.1 hypothetical protein OPR90_08955 [Pseudomonas aeruginosa]